MNKTVKKSLIIIAIVIVLFAIIWLVYDMFKKDTVDTSSDTNIVDGNTGLDNIINDLFENDMIENDVIGSEIENEVTENVTSNSSKENGNTKNEPDTTEKTTSKEEKAIELAKKEWGEDDTVTFSVDEKKDSKYYVAVKQDATVIQWYEVDTNNWTISEY